MQYSLQLNPNSSYQTMRIQMTDKGLRLFDKNYLGYVKLAKKLLEQIKHRVSPSDAPDALKFALVFFN